MNLRRTLSGLCIVLAVASAGGAVYAAEYANESKDFGVSEMKSPKGPPYASATPMTVPGGKTVTTDELKAMLGSENKPVLVDALASSVMIEGAAGLGAGIGEQRMFGRERDMFPKALEALTGGDKSKPIVFYCRSSSCWHSYNASLHAIDAGYTNIFWYRGGIDAWRASRGTTVPYSMSTAAK
jgi:rhodanese-related sulfurtransferase